jgi:hypothetical protein
MTRIEIGKTYRFVCGVLENFPTVQGPERKRYVIILKDSGYSIRSYLNTNENTFHFRAKVVYIDFLDKSILVDKNSIKLL